MQKAISFGLPGTFPLGLDDVEIPKLAIWLPFAGRGKPVSVEIIEDESVIFPAIMLLSPSRDDAFSDGVVSVSLLVSGDSGYDIISCAETAYHALPIM